jgi:hypothetical protein
VSGLFERSICRLQNHRVAFHRLSVVPSVQPIAQTVLFAVSRVSRAARALVRARVQAAGRSPAQDPLASNTKHCMLPQSAQSRTWQQREHAR